ncbi:MAG: RNA methyltransferase [Thermoprotei archaeon]|nr:MAG: RNA methyltransferase [Thermoprotei archaeon]
MIGKDFNLLVSTGRMRELDCKSELMYLLREIGDDKPSVRTTGIPGLVVAKTNLDPFEAVNRLRKLLEERPWEFRFTLKVVPIEIVVDTDLELIRKEAVRLANEKIKENETFKIVINRRFTTLGRREVIETVASGINRKVNLDNPDKIVEIEILGGITGISVLKPGDILSVVKVKRRLGLKS